MMLRFSIILAIAVVVGLSQPNAPTPGIVNDVDFCTVVKSPAKYDRQMISTKGVLLPGEHSVSFYDPACVPSEANRVGAQGVLEASATPTGLVKKLRRLFRRQSAAMVEAEGVFYSNGGPFGADAASFRFVIKQLRSVEKK
jgi:hypothetical protein